MQPKTKTTPSMYIMYVDESGDPGTTGSQTPSFILSAIIVHESNWLRFLNDVIKFRQHLKKTKGLMMKEEIHASEFLSKRIKLKSGVPRNDRLDILKSCIKWLGSKSYLNIITVKVDKATCLDPFSTAWWNLLQRFENTLKAQNFPNPAFSTDLGIIVSDNTDGEKLTKLLRKMRRINFVPSMFTGSPSRNMPVQHILKDPVFRESSDSYLIQMADVVVYFARQYFHPSKYIRQKAAKNYYSNLTSIINQHANKKNIDHRIIQV